jgi:beta-aspartyl-peptidase (threonine type)
MSPDKKIWSIIIHGGAGAILPEREDMSRKAALAALEKGADTLRQGGSALDAVEESIRVMEEDGVFNAGRGAVLRMDGQRHLDASIMDGRTLAIGAIACVQNIQNPVSVARSLLNENPVLLTGESAMQYARANGVPLYDGPYAVERGGRSSDTVGCVARDQDNNIACGLSTGGLSSRLPGALGDAPLPGCGFYADNTRGGLCLSGDGESISRVILAAEIMRRLETMSAEDAIEDGLLLLDRVGGEAGCILIDQHGNIAWSHKSDHYAVAYQTQDTEAFVSLKKARSGAV